MDRRLTLVTALLGSTLCACASASNASAPAASERQLGRCQPAFRLLTQQLGMAAEISVDTVSDWRTHLQLPGCRITAAGSIAPGPEDYQAESFFNSVRAAGWTRTPDPRDMPNESAIRFRMNDVDCFFNRYLGIMIGSTEEMRVNAAYRGRAGDSRFNVMVQCVEALPAAP